jgi:hypothetical protein
MGRDQKLALLVNAYNAFTLRLILDHYPLKSIKDIPEKQRWDDKRWNVGGRVWSLSQIEHEQIRPKFKEPRPLRQVARWAARRCGAKPIRSRSTNSSNSGPCSQHERWFDSTPTNVYLTALQLVGGD